MIKLKKCSSCNLYTVKESCPKCNSSARVAHPPKYSKEDKYAAYRRKEKFG